MTAGGVKTEATRAIEALLAEVEALCLIHCGKAAEGEPWGETCDRFDRLDKAAKKLRKALAKAGQPS